MFINSHISKALILLGLLLVIAIAGNAVGATPPFMVTSSSFSTTGTGTPVSLSTSGSYTSNFFVISGDASDGGATPTNTIANVIVDSASEVVKTSDGTRYLNSSVLGHNSITGTVTYSSCSTACNTAIAALSANVIYTANTINGASYFAKGVTSDSATFTLTFPVATANSFVVILYSLSGAKFNVAPATNAIGCTLVQNTESGNLAAAAIMECNALGAGTYSANIVTPASASHGAYDIGAYVFAPYTVTLDDSPTSGTVTPNGISTQTNGNTISAIGTNTIVANPPAGYTFQKWSAGNSNILVANTLASTTTLTVEGAGTLTAKYGPTPSIATLPANIISYIPITLYNGQSSAFVANAQVAIPFDALSYQSLESNSLNNTEFFYANSTVIPSFLEGNTLNEAGAANILYKSANVSYFVRIYPSNTFLCATCFNTIYLGFASKTTNLLSNTIDGEAPQLSSTYGLYDTGANVFTAYDNFAGTSLSSPTWNVISQASGTETVNNGITFNSVSGTSVIILDTKNNYAGPLFTEADEVSFTGTPDPIIGEATSNVPNTCVELTNGYTMDDAISGVGTGTETFQAQTAAGCQPTPMNQISTGFHSGVWSLGWINAGNEIATDTVDSFSGSNVLTVANYKGVVGLSNSGAGTNLVQWFRMRTAPPNTVAPDTYYNPTVNLLTATPNPNKLTNKTIDISQISLANTVISNGVSGTSSYTGNWYWVPPASSNIVAGNTIVALLPISNNALTLTINAVSSTSMKLTFNGINYFANAIGSNTVYGTWTFNAFAGDANNDISPSPALTNTLKVSSDPTLSTPIPSNVVLDFGQSVVYNVIISGGTGPFTVNLINGGAVVNTLTGQSVGTVTFGPNTPATGSETFNVIAADTGATTPYIINSVSNTINVNAALAVAAPTVSAISLDIDQTETVTGTIPSTGTSPYTYNWLVSNNGGAYAQTALCATNSGTGQTEGNTVTCSIAANTLIVGHTYSFKLQVTDSPSFPTTATSSASGTVTVSSQLTGASKPTLSANIIDADQAETLTSVIPSTGTSPYSYTWHISTNGGGYAGATQCTTNTGSGQAAGNTVTCAIPANTLTGGNSYNFELEVVDSANAPEGTFSTASNTITVHTAMSVSTPLVSATALDIDQAETVTGTIPSTGTSPYTYNWLVSNNLGAYAPTAFCATNSGTGQAAGNTVTCSIAANTLIVGHTYSFKLRVTDSAPTPETVSSSASSTVTVASQLTVATTPTLSANIIDADQVETLNSILPSTGTSTYTYTWFTSVNGGGYTASTQCTVNTLSGQSGGNTATCTRPPNSLTAGNIYNFELEVVDSASAPEATFSIPSNTITVHSAMSVSVPTVSSTGLDIDQTETVTGTIPSTGTSPYTYNWLVSNNGGAYAQTALCATNSGTGQAAGNTVTCSIAANTLIVGHTYSFKLRVTDSAPTPETVSSSASSTVTVASQLTVATTPTLSANIIDADQVETLTSVLPSTGTGTYTYTWHISTNGGGYSGATQCTTNSLSGQSGGSTATCTIPANTLTGGNTYSFALEVVDSATSQESTFSAASNTITVHTATSVSTPLVSAASLDFDQQETVTGTIPSTGTSPYTYNWLVSNNGGGYALSSLCSTNSGTGQAAGNTVTCSIAGSTLTVGHIYSFKLQVADSASAPELVSSSASPTVTVSSQLTSATTPTVSANIITSNQVETLTSVIPSTGTSPYSYTWHLSTNGGGYSGATQCTVNTGSGQSGGTTETCTIPANTLAGGNSYNFELEVVDSATAQESTFSPASTTITVLAAVVNTPIPSATSLDVDQAETITGIMPSTGVSPYTYNWLISTNAGGYAPTTQCSANSGTGQATGNTVTCVIAANTLSVGSTYNFELETTDSLSATSTSPASQTVTVSSRFTAASTPTVSANVLDADQVETLTSVIPSTGTSPYSYTWHRSTDGGAYAGSTECTTNTLSGQSGGSTATCTIPANTLTGGNTYNFELEVVDSANVPEGTFSAASNTITVKPALTVATPTASAPNLDLDQAETVTGTIPSTGASPYTYNWLVSTGGGYSATAFCSANSGTGQTQGNTVICSILPNTLTIGTSYTFKLKITDSASTPSISTSSASQTVSVSSRLTSATTPTISLNVIDQDPDIAEILTSVLPSTGTSPYSYTWHRSTNGGGYSGATECSVNTGSGQTGGATETCTAPGNNFNGGNSYNFELEVVDGATSQESLFSSPSNTITVFFLDTPGTAVASAPSLDVDQLETITGTVPFNGIPPYTYNWIVSDNGGAYAPTTSQCAVNSGTEQTAGNTVTCSIAANTLTAGHNYKFEVQAADSGNALDLRDSSPTQLITVSSLLTAATKPTISANILDADQVETLTSVLPSTGSSPYIYTWFASINGGGFTTATQCTTNTLSGQSGGSTATCTIPGNTLTVGNTYSFELDVVDSANSPEGAFSPASNTITVKPALVVATPTLSAINLDVDQAETVTGTIPSTGTSPYTYNWLVSNNLGAYAQTALCATNSGTGQAASNTVLCSIAANTLIVGHTYSFKLQVTDSSSPPATASSSPSSTVTVSSQLTTATKPTLSANIIDADQAETVTGIIPSTGTATYTYTWHTSVNGGGFVGSTECTADTGAGQAAGNTVTCTIPGNTLTAGNTYSFALEVVDSATAQESSFSAGSNTLTVNLALSPSAPVIGHSVVDTNNQQTVTVGVSGGTPPYTYNFGIYNSTTNTLLTSSGGQTTSATTNAFSFNPTIVGTYYANIVITDSPSIPDSTTMASGTFIVSVPLENPTTPALNRTSLAIGQSILITSTVVGGTPPYTYEFLVSNATNGTTSASSGNLVTSSNHLSFIYSPTSVGSFQVNVTVTENAIPPSPARMTNSIESAVFTVTPAPAPSHSTSSTGGLPASTSLATTTAASTTIPTASTTIPSGPPPALNSTYNFTGGETRVINVSNTLSVTLTSPSGGSYNVTITNVTSSTIPPISNVSIVAYSVSVTPSSNLDVTLTMAYPCSVPSNEVTPYSYSGAWRKIKSFSVDPSSCTVKVFVHQGTVGLFYSATPTSAPSPVTNNTISAPATQSPQANYRWDLLILILIAVVVAGVWYFIVAKRRHKKKPERPQ